MNFKNIFFPLFVAVICLTISSCDREVAPEKDYENLPIRSISVSASAPFEEVNVATKASDLAETKLETLDLIVIPKRVGGTAVVLSGCALSVERVITSTHYHYTATFDVPESAGLRYGEYYLYAVGNASHKYVHADVSALQGKTKDEVDAFLASKDNAETDFSETALLMAGKYGSDGSVYLDNVENDLQDTIHLFRIVSKNTVTISSIDGITFEPTSYSIYNYPLSCSLFERDAWDGDAPKTGFDYLGDAGASAFTKIENRDYDKGSNSFTFYMPENMQTTFPAEPAAWSYNYREVRTDYVDNDYTADKHSRFAYAPANATYVVVKGNYRDSEYTGTVSYTIHLGGFSTHADNFSVRRNYKYNYNITVRGVRNIIAEAKATPLDGGSDMYQSGAEGDILNKGDNTIIEVDSHYEQVMISFKSLAETTDYSLLVSTPFTSGTIVDNGGNSLSDEDVEWIKFGKPTAAGKFAAYNPSNVGTIYDLIADLKNKTGRYYMTSGDRTMICAYVDEYFYSDKAIADFVAADNRYLQLSISNVDVSLDKNSTFTSGVLFRITQKSIKCDEALTLAVPFGYESIEETTPNCGDTSPSGNNTVTIPSAVSTGPEGMNGWANFSPWLLNLSAGNRKWNRVVDIANNGHFSESDAGAAMQSAYDLGWYQCMSRNRDENGDGVIDAEEIKWYLPSVNQYLTLMVGRERYFDEFVTGVDNPLYLTSSTSYKGNGDQRTWFAAEGLAYGKFGPSWWNDWNLHVRCVRTLSAYDAAPSDVYTYTAMDRTFDVSGLLPEVMRTSSMVGGYESHNLSNSTLTRLPKKFIVAEDDLDVSGSTRFSVEAINGDDLCAQHYSEGPSDLGQWRIPNAKEFYLMVKEGLVTAGSSSRTMSAYYNSSGSYSTDGSQLIFYYLGVISTSNQSHPWNDNNMLGACIRCVRDVPDGGDETDMGEGGDI